MRLTRRQLTLLFLLATVRSDAEAVLDVSASIAGIPLIAVIYPDIGEPFHRVFSEIIKGISEATNGRMQHFAVGAHADADELAARLKRNNIKVAIALGRQGVKATSALERDVEIVVGGVQLFPGAGNRLLSGISLCPDPALLFARLNVLQPETRRIFVLYDPRYNEWLINLAREAAKTSRLELVAQTAPDLATAARLHEAILSAAEPRRDAIWLPQDPTTVDDNIIVPLVLKASWERGLMVFSSTLSHVRRGAVFALYPDNRELGHQLALFALSMLSGEFRKGIVPLRAVETALNVRTASHLGLNPADRKHTYAMIFPEAQ